MGQTLKASLKRAPTIYTHVTAQAQGTSVVKCGYGHMCLVKMELSDKATQICAGGKKNRIRGSSSKTPASA